MSNKNPYDNIISNALDYADYFSEDPTGVGFIGNLLYPGFQQQAEFGQQIAFQQMQNDWSVGGKFQAMKDIGINANVAANGIASGATPSVGAPNSAVGAGAQSTNALGQVGETLNNAVNAATSLYEKAQLTPVEKNRRKAEIRNLLSSALHNDWLAYSISELLPDQKQNQRADTYLKIAQYDVAKEEKNLIKKRVDEAQAHIDELKEQARLYHEQGNLVMYEQTRTLYETQELQLRNDKLQWDKDWRERFRYDPNQPVDVALEQAMVNDSGEAVKTAIGESVKNIEYNEQKGLNLAEIEDGYDKALQSLKADKDLQAQFAPYIAKIEANKQAVIEYIKMLTDNPNDIKGAIAKLANLMAQFGLSSPLTDSPVNNAHLPSSGKPLR